jgi:general stress protein YciG
MKKAILTIGLFSLMMILTSFTTPETTNNIKVKNSTAVELVGGQATGGNQKLDLVGGQATGGNQKLDLVGGQATGGNQKLDLVGGQATGGNQKLD